jgi:23S rRNA (cytosine1962-C5)-methyltransferase
VLSAGQTAIGLDLPFILASGAISEETAVEAMKAERDVQILEKLSQTSDHPILATLPESEYLKGFLCRVW